MKLKFVLLCMIKYKIKRKIVNCEKIESVTSHDLYPPLPPVTNCHTFSDPLPPLERDILYGRPLSLRWLEDIQRLTDSEQSLKSCSRATGSFPSRK